MPLPKPPPKLKPIVAFITRAHQIENHNAVIAYWCYYWAVQIILSNNLHSGDAECTTYTTMLLDELEARKEKLLPNDAVTDDLAAQAYVENFALKVFTIADNALQARKVTRQTVDKFLAAATFLELCKIFPNVDGEILAKIKFSKYQAARILKAFQAGEDPNLPLPPVQADPVNPEPQQQQGTYNRSPPATPPRPSVEEVPDEDGGSSSNIKPFPMQSLPRPATSSSFHDTLHTQASELPDSPPTPPRVASPSRSIELPTTQPGPSAPDQSYFPTIPHSAPYSSLAPVDNNPSAANTPQDILSPFHQPTGQPEPLAPPPPLPENLIRSPLDDPHAYPSPPQYPSAPPAPPPQFPQQHYDQSSALRHTYPSAPPPPNHLPPPSAYYSAAPTPPGPGTGPMSHYGAPPPGHYHHHTPPPPQSIPPPPLMVDEESITKAQKHAKWAISALNYDDIPTAVKELRLALKVLGAS